MEERPRILTKHDDKKSGRVSPEKKPESPLEVTEKGGVSSFQRTPSSSSDPPTETTRPRVTFADDVIESTDDKDGANQHPQGRRMPMHKIMLRKMGEKDGDPSGERGREVGQGAGGGGRQSKSGDTDVATAESAKPKTAWSSNERGPIISPKTLYEPEGKQSAAKFKKYQAQTREQQGNRGSHDLATPTSEGGTTPTGERPDGTKRDETSSPVDRAGQSSPSGKERRPPDHRKGGRRQEKGEKPPFQERDSHDYQNRPQHRKENSRRERIGGSEHPDGPKAKPERLTSTEDGEFVRDEHEHSRGKAPPRRRDQHEESRPPLLGNA